jgi:hypothetical protein
MLVPTNWIDDGLTIRQEEITNVRAVPSVVVAAAACAVSMDFASAEFIG